MSDFTLFEMYKANIGEDKPFLGLASVLSEYDFMIPYLEAYDDLDSYFAMKWKTFIYKPMYEANSAVNAVYDLNNNVLKGFFKINKKKLSELFRMEGIDDELYSLYNNYDMTETAHSEATIDTGARTDTQSVNPYDGSAFTESGQNEMGAQHNTSGGDSTLHRVGNIGVMTVSDMLTRHDDLFSKYVSFYDKLFSMIVDEYLYIGGY